MSGLAPHQLVVFPAYENPPMQPFIFKTTLPELEAEVASSLMQELSSMAREYSFDGWHRARVDVQFNEQDLNCMYFRFMRIDLSDLPGGSHLPLPGRRHSTHQRHLGLAAKHGPARRRARLVSRCRGGSLRPGQADSRE